MNVIEGCLNLRGYLCLYKSCVSSHKILYIDPIVHFLFIIDLLMYLFSVYDIFNIC